MKAILYFETVNGDGWVYEIAPVDVTIQYQCNEAKTAFSFWFGIEAESLNE